MIELRYRGAETLDYKKSDLSDLKYIKLVYSDVEGEVHEIKTITNYLSDNYISLYIKKYKKEEYLEDDNDDNIDIWSGNDENAQIDAALTCSEYLDKLAKIKQIKEKTESLTDDSEYYKLLAEMKDSKFGAKSKKPQKDEEVQPEEEPKEDLNDEAEEGQDDDKEYEVNCPQEVFLKFVIDDLLYTTKAVLNEVEVKPSKVYFRISAPQILQFEQRRKFYRIDLKRTCILIGNKHDGKSDTFVSRSINLSAGGVLIHKLENLTSSKYVSIQSDDYESFNLIIVLEMEKILKLKARFVREEKGKKSNRYAFEFIEISSDKTDFISKYIIRKQFEKLNAEYNIKNKSIIPKGVSTKKNKL